MAKNLTTPRQTAQLTGDPARPPVQLTDTRTVAAFSEFADGVKASMDKVAAETARIGEAVAPLMPRIEAVESRTAELAKSADKRFEELKSGDQFAEIREQLQKLDASGKRLEAVIGSGGFGSDRRDRRTFADEVATHKDLDEYIKSGCPKSHVRWNVKNRIDPRSRGAFAGESTVVVDADLMSDGSLPATRPGLTELLRDSQLGLVDVINFVPPVMADTYQTMVEDDESEKGFVAAKLSAALTGRTVTAVNTIAVANVEGFQVGQGIYIFSSDTTDEGRHGPFTIASKNTTNLTFASALIDFDAASGDLVVSETYMATGESSTKPAGVLKASLVNCTMQTLASYIITTRQRLMRTNLFDLGAWANKRLPERLREVLEWHLLYGRGPTTYNELNGFLQHASLTTDTWSTDMSPGDTRADLILWAGAQIPGSPALTCVMHKLDWFALTNAKNSDGNYVHGEGEGPRIINTPALKAVGDVRVVISSKIAQTNALILAPEASSDMAPGGDDEMIVGYVNDQMIQNQWTMLYESSYAHLIKQARAFRKIDFDGAPAAV
jgi:hypothetical protein